MIITTKQGDGGLTRLYKGKQVSKANLTIGLLGLVDETQAVLGMVKATVKKPAEIISFISEEQSHLYDLMSELSGAKVFEAAAINEWVAKIEQEQQRLLKTATISNKFVLPGQNPLEAWCHIARTKIRELERSLVQYEEEYPAFKKYVPYLNRLSDVFFTLSQYFLR